MSRSSRGVALVVLSFVLLPNAACDREAEPDAYGNVEAVEVVVGAEASGLVETFAPREGSRLAAGEVVGTIETTRLALEGEQVAAQAAVAASRLGEIARQIDAIEVEREIARRGYERTRRLADQRAATARELDQAERELRLTGERIEIARAQAATVRREVEAIEARRAEVAERIDEGRITNPVDGTVLATHVRAGEVVQAGQPLYRIADLESLEVRAYVSGGQLASVAVGRPVGVTVDVGAGERRSLPGTITWISPDAEFTPTPIQTREERADLVYAVKVRVANPDGLLKIGMPAEVELAPPDGGR
ncbi:MAG TPA: HlyD family efflux transporter periplasmic adaptor subunit [Thermoanaerobaculia bacterium]|nr:HlyD family efflux transporter periplasmic adaptor subunit [Thermoanaerobaculia bacterium]